MLEHVQTAAMAVDDDGRVGVYNAAAARVVGVAVEDVVGARPRRAGRRASGDSLPLAAILREARRSGRAATRRQIEAPTPAGVRTLGYTVSILGEGGAAALFFADITDALAQERRAAEARRFAEVGQIASAMAHELKSPLATVELYANLLRRQHSPTSPPPCTRWTSSRTRRGAASSASAPSCTRSTPTRARGRRGAHAAAPCRARGRGRSAAPLRGVRDHAQGRRPATPESRSPRTSCVRWSPTCVVNALEVSGGKGTVDVSLGATPKGCVCASPTRVPGCPTATCSPPSTAPSRAAPALASGWCAAWSRRPAASIAAADRRGGGAVFEVELPLPRHERLRGAAPARRRGRRAPPRRRCRRPRGLRRRCDRRRRREGCANGSHAWECAILDYHLPDLTGVEIAARLPAGTPILMVSGDPAAGAALAEVRERRAWYLPKPFAVETYLDLVSLLVGSA